MIRLPSSDSCIIVLIDGHGYQKGKPFIFTLFICFLFCINFIFLGLFDFYLIFKHLHAFFVSKSHNINVSMYWGDVKIPHSRITKNMLGNIGDLFVKCMRQAKGYLYHLSGVLDYYVMYGQRIQSVL